MDESTWLRFVTPDGLEYMDWAIKQIVDGKDDITIEKFLEEVGDILVMAINTEYFKLEWQDGYNRVWISSEAGGRWVYYSEIDKLLEVK